MYLLYTLCCFLSTRDSTPRMWLVSHYHAVTKMLQLFLGFAQIWRYSCTFWLHNPNPSSLLQGFQPLCQISGEEKNGLAWICLLGPPPPQCKSQTVPQVIRYTNLFSPQWDSSFRLCCCLAPFSWVTSCCTDWKRLRLYLQKSRSIFISQHEACCVYGFIHSYTYTLHVSAMIAVLSEWFSPIPIPHTLSYPN